MNGTQFSLLLVLLLFVIILTLYSIADLLQVLVDRNEVLLLFFKFILNAFELQLLLLKSLLCFLSSLRSLLKLF